MNARRWFLSGGICLGLIALTTAPVTPAFAQEDPSRYPTRPVHIIVGFSAGRRQVTGKDDPASTGTNSSRARSYIHFASAHSAARCLSVNTGTDFFDASKTLHVSSKKRRRG